MMSPALLMLTMTMSHCRYMKCLTIGMNPNYVLSEDEKKKRFRRKNNSGGGTDEENVKSPAVPGVAGGFNTGMRMGTITWQTTISPLLNILTQ